MNYVNDIHYLNRGFLTGQLLISTDRDGRSGAQVRGDIKAFKLEGHTFTIEVTWLASRPSTDAPWEPSNEPLTYTFNMNEWRDNCHGGGRIGLTKAGEKKVYLIVPERNGTTIQRPAAAVK